MAHVPENSDYFLALVLQSEFDNDFGIPAPKVKATGHKRAKTPILIEDNGPVPAKKFKSKSLIDPDLEIVDPTPDIHSLFRKFNKTFFWSALVAVEVRWSPRMYKCAGICSYEGRRGLCSVRLSEPLLKLRPRSDLVETLLHEMIHAYLFVTHNNKDRDGHGPEFKKHMYRINAAAGTNISVYHDFHEEVKLYEKHWWRCDGVCRNRPPFFGLVKRTMNRKPGPSDFWWSSHQASCGGTFIKVREPEPKSNKVKTKENVPKKPDIRDFWKNSTSNSSNKVVGINDLKKNIDAGGAKKKIPINPLNSGKVVDSGKNSTNRIVGFGDLSNQIKNDPRKNVFGGEGKKLGTGALKGRANTGGTAVMNKGTGTSTVTSKSNTKIETKGKTDVKPSENFVPFVGAGNKLGGSIAGSSRVKGNSKPISPLVFTLYQPNSESKSVINSPEKYKSDFHNITISDDELAEVDGDQFNGNCSKNNQYSPEKFKVDFHNSTLSDDDFADLEEPTKSRNNHESIVYSPEKYRDEFQDKSNSDDDLVDIDIDCGDDKHSNNDIVPCPVCNFKIHRDDMSIHLQSCDILNSTVEFMSNSAVLEMNGDGEEVNSIFANQNDGNSSQPDNCTLPCPCCSKYVKEENINKHLDECLSLLAIKEFEKEF